MPSDAAIPRARRQYGDRGRHGAGALHCRRSRKSSPPPCAGSNNCGSSGRRRSCVARPRTPSDFTIRSWPITIAPSNTSRANGIPTASRRATTGFMNTMRERLTSPRLIDVGQSRVHADVPCAKRLATRPERRRAPAHRHRSICRRSRFGAAGFAKMVRSPHAHARIMAIDTSAGHGVPGRVGGSHRRRPSGRWACTDPASNRKLEDAVRICRLHIATAPSG